MHALLWVFHFSGREISSLDAARTGTPAKTKRLVIVSRDWSTMTIHNKTEWRNIGKHPILTDVKHNCWCKRLSKALHKIKVYWIAGQGLRGQNVDYSAIRNKLAKISIRIHKNLGITALIKRWRWSKCCPKTTLELEFLSNFDHNQCNHDARLINQESTA